MPSVVFDFGSSNSGAVINTFSGKSYDPSDLIYVHKRDTETNKQPTVFWIKRSLIDKPEITEEDINVYSCVFYQPELKNSANFIWCSEQIKDALDVLTDNDEWLRIDFPKMELYNNSDPRNAKIRAHNRTEVSYSKVLKIFFLVIKKDVKKRMETAKFNNSDIQWAITVPGLAIWHQNSIEALKTIASSAFGENVTFLLEPEAALLGINLAGSDTLDFQGDRYSLVADLGGGTADFSVIKETCNADGSMTFDEEKTTPAENDSVTSERAGGNDIDRRFIEFFCELLTGCQDIALYKSFRQEEPRGDMVFMEKWHELQFSTYLGGSEVGFQPGMRFTNWLRESRYSALIDKFQDGVVKFDGVNLRERVFEPVYKKILSSLEIHLKGLEHQGKRLDVIYFAGGLSLDKRLKEKIENLVYKYFPNAYKKEASRESTIGAVQRGGDYLLRHENLIRRMARRTYYTSFALKYNGNDNDLKAMIKMDIRNSYCDILGLPWITEEEINEIIDKQWKNRKINYINSSVSLLAPLCIKYAPVSNVIRYNCTPYEKGQTGMSAIVFMSNETYRLFPDDEEVECVGSISHDFGVPWTEAVVVFDPTSNPVDGSAKFQLLDNNGNKLKEFVIENVTKKGL